MIAPKVDFLHLHHSHINKQKRGITFDLQRFLIHFTAVGIINIPDTEEILEILEEIRTKPLRIA